MFVGCLVAAHSAAAQSAIAGRVLSDSGRIPLAGAEVSLGRSNLRVATDSAGRFTIRGVPPGQHLLLTRALGFLPDSSTIEIGQDETLSFDVRLKRAVTSLDVVRVTDSAPRAVPAKLAAFEDRRHRIAGGHFLDRSLIEKWEGHRTAELVSLVPGVNLLRAGGKAFATGSRALPSFSSSPRADPCYMDVYLDGALVYSKAAAGGAPFDLNSIGLPEIAAIEVYTGPANTPPEFNRTSKGCGVIAVWTR